MQIAPESLFRQRIEPSLGKIGIAVLILFFSLFTPFQVVSQAAETSPQTVEAAFPPPGADALNLKISKHYKVENDGSVRHRLYVRRRILTYKGKKDYADFKYTYNQAFEKVRLIGARTFKADGETVKVGDKEVHDIPAPWNSGASLYSRTRQLVVNLPAVEPGCEIEIEIEVTSDIGFWCAEYFRFSDPILDKEVVIEAPASLPLKFLPPARLQLAHSTRKTENDTVIHSWQARKVPGLTPARWAPDEAEQGYCLLASSFADNRAVAAFFRRGFPGLEGEKKRAQRAATTPPGQAAGNHPASFRIFQELSRKATPLAISFQETDMQVQAPAKTAANGYGRDADLALLFSHKLKQKKIPARILMTCNDSRFPGVFGDFPWPGWWDATVVESQGHFFYFGSDKPAPGITGCDGCPALDLESGQLVTIHDRKPAAATTRVELFPGTLPTATGTFMLTLKGSAATGWRRDWRNLSPGEKRIAASQLLHELNPTAEYTAPIRISGLEEPLTPLVFRGRFKIGKLFTRLDNHRFLMPLPAPDFPSPWPTLLRNRKQPVAVSENFTLRNRLVLHLGQKLRLADLPAGIEGKTANFQWQAAARFDPETGTLNCVRNFSQQRGIVSAASNPDYGKFLAAVRALAANENLGIVLEQTAQQ